jgi:hypothetical protein
MKSEDNPMLTEPEIILALAEDFEQRVDQHSLFLSNSMPIRDAECFLYPFTKEEQRLGLPSLQQIGTNRGASGIDGIISSAFGFSESIQSPTTLVIGDLATLHDVSSLHSLATDMARSYNQARAKKRSPLTTIVVNNDGGGIFSFLPIAQHGNDVAFDEFFGTPTNSFSFEKGAEAFGLTFDRATDYSSFRKVYTTSQQTSKHRLIEARVAGRAANVAIHRGVTKRVETLIGALLKEKAQKTTDSERLSIKQYSVQNSESKAPKNRRTLVLLHGWMGEKTDWDEVADELVKRLGQNWTVISVDVSHGLSLLQLIAFVVGVPTSCFSLFNVPSCPGMVRLLLECRLIFRLSRQCCGIIRPQMSLTTVLMESLRRYSLRCANITTWRVLMQSEAILWEGVLPLL